MAKKNSGNPYKVLSSGIPAKKMLKNQDIVVEFPKTNI